MDHRRGINLEKDEGRVKESSLERELGAKVEDEDSVASHKNEEDFARKEIGTATSDESIEDEVQDDIPEEERKDLEAARTTSRTVSVRDLGSIPDGGAKAWLQVLGSFFLFFNSW